jgi:hypothetical protein
MTSVLEWPVHFEADISAHIPSHHLHCQEKQEAAQDHYLWKTRSLNLDNSIEVGAEKVLADLQKERVWWKVSLTHTATFPESQCLNLKAVVPSLIRNNLRAATVPNELVLKSAQLRL